MKGRQQSGRLAQSPLGPVSHHRPADPPRGREADPDQRLAVAAIKPLGRNRALRAGLALGRGQEVASLLQAFDGGDDGAP
jgi:hypothetical protein